LKGNKRGRILRIVCDEPLSYVVATTVQSNVSVETWFVPELQLNPTLHVDVPEHRVYDQMTPEEIAEIPKPLRQAAETDKMKLDVLLPTDMMSRWYGFVRGQMICAVRRNKLEFGCTYNIRFVR
jgi:DNA-directed RNA polymerase subunit H (RpoH/RPB5)